MVNIDLDADAIESLDFVIYLLSSSQLYAPQIMEVNDTDVNEFLNNMITNGRQTTLTGEEAQAVAPERIIQSQNPNIMIALQMVDEWSFDIFQLHDVTQGRPLFHLGMALFDAYGMEEQFKIESRIMANFLTRVEDSYQKNTYHNSTHAADVMHAMHYFIHVLGLGDLISSSDILACFIAAAIHDVDHPGFNNAYMIATSSPLALRYNDISVLENYHCSKGFEIMNSDPSMNVLGSFPPERFKELRAMICSMVLATDMAGHFEYIAKFKNKINGAGKLYSTRY